MNDFLGDMFSNLLDMLSTFFGWVGSLVDGLINLATQVGKAIIAIPSFISWLPDGIVTILITGFGVVAAYKILGREG